jgi:hypothetical protein
LVIQVVPESLEVKKSGGGKMLATAASLFPSAEEVIEIQALLEAPVWVQVSPESTDR